MKHRVKTEAEVVKDRKAATATIVETYEFLAIEQALDLVRLTRQTQLHTFGESEDWDDGTGSAEFAELYGHQRKKNTRARNMGELTWRDVILSDVWAALAEPHPDILRAKVANLAATALAWVEALEQGSR